MRERAAWDLTGEDSGTSRGAEGECVEQSQAAAGLERNRWKGSAARWRRRRGRPRPCGARGPRARVWLLVLITWEPLGAAQSEEVVPETCLSSDTDFKFRGSHTTKVESFAGMTQDSLKAMKLIAHYRDDTD